MSRQLINEYRSELDRIIKVGGTLNEGTVRDAFQSLLKSWGRSHDLTYLSEHKIVTPKGNTIWVDGALVYDIRVPFGYWEAKDSRDDLEEEIRKKEAKGYPRTNIIYEDTKRAILIQDRQRVAMADMADTDQLYDLLTKFFAYEQQAIRDFRKAIAKFAEDLPDILDALRNRIRGKRDASPDFSKAEEAFLKQVKETINPALERADVTEMLIQHILTADIFNRVFDMRDYHRHNNIAQQLEVLDNKLFERGDRQALLSALRPYYTGIESTAHLIQSHSEKQNFLKSLYENFYKVYNPKAADRLGVVYTPGEIVRFMIRSADWLCEKHFGKNLVDPGVEILDPATGTGTYIVELLEYFRGQPDKLRQKYEEELHANEVAILPYYVANLNIEATYQAITGEFAEFEGLCLVDTLDNVDGLGIHSGHQFDMLGAISDENIERVKRQNRRKISVIIGNPPYNANQRNENDNNKNREYPHIDDRIKRTYINESSARKTKLYDMYSRFFRWASDRLGDEGIIAFITNRSFIESRTFDGFRKVVSKSFGHIWVIDLGGDYKRKDYAGGGNVFGIGTGVAICFLVREKSAHPPAQLTYASIESAFAEDKLTSLERSRLNSIADERQLRPNKDGDWLFAESAFPDGWLQIAGEATKSGIGRKQSIFQLYTLGVVTNRDDWVYDRDRSNLVRKIKALLSGYQEGRERLKQASQRAREDFDFGKEIKWTRHLKRVAKKAREITFSTTKTVEAQFRPFTKRFLYFDRDLNEMQYRTREAFDSDLTGAALCFSTGQRGKFQTLAVQAVPSLDMFLPNACQTLPRLRYTKSGERIDNITDWALNQFAKHYGKKTGVTKDTIFAYCYAVLHDPVYREKYALNLKREFPRIPFYPDFAQWAQWGETLLDLHIDYEDVDPYPLERVDTPNPKRAEGSHPKPKLKSVLAEGAKTGSVVVDEDTQLTGIPAGAWSYRLGNRSAIDWVLDQHKEKKPRDPTIREKFNTYRFADYKESMIELLGRVVRVSVETNAITDAMAALDRSDWEVEAEA